MNYIITANGTAYTVTYHASRRMIQRFISEEQVITVLEAGTIKEQNHGTDLYEYDWYDRDAAAYRTLQVIVDPSQQLIISVISIEE